MNWEPFLVTTERSAAPRPLTTPEGIGDRLRAAGFAEIQAREAFLWAADHFPEVSEELKQAWRMLAKSEDRHLEWLLRRLEELGIDVKERAVSTQLWQSLVSCKSAQEFAHYMASSEERGRRAGVRFYQELLKIDPISANIFGKIAEEEVSHIALAHQYFPTGL